MEGLLGIVAIGVGICSLVCWIWVLVFMFKTSIITGICGLVCPIYALFWGFQNKDEHGLGAVMGVWSVCVLINLAFRFLL